MQVVVGIGCDRDSSRETLEQAVAQALAEVGVTWHAVQTLATIDQKQDETGLLALAGARGKSGRRRQHIVEAQRILLQYREPETPVAIVRSAYRERQRVELTTLANMADCDISMLSTVLIGNCSTFVRHGLMVTPRGYTHKYKHLTREVNPGEQAGRSYSMGLTGWTAAVCRYLRHTPGASLQQAARYFEVPVGEVLEALAHPRSADPVAHFEVAMVPKQQHLEVLHATCQWGPLRAVIHTEAGAVTELLIEGQDLKHASDWLNASREHGQLWIPWAQVRAVWFLSQGSIASGVLFIDRRGELLFGLWLVSQAGAHDPAALQYFLDARERLCMQRSQVPLPDVR